MLSPVQLSHLARVWEILFLIVNNDIDEDDHWRTCGISGRSKRSDK
jgi:hypothetical protein